MKCTVEEAIEFAKRKHEGQTRKGSDVPYVTHVIRVSDRLDDELERVVALLHDTLEDTDTTYEELVQFAGQDVALCVAALSEDKSLDRSGRKAGYAKSLEMAPLASVNVAVADKVDNMRSMLQSGVVDWSLFSGSPTETYAFYSLVLQVVLPRTSRPNLLEEYRELLEMLWAQVVQAELV